MPLMASVPPLLARAGGEVGQELIAPGAQGPAEPGDLGDRAGGERLEHLRGDGAALGEVGGGERRPQLLVAAPGDGDLEVRVAGLEPGFDSVDLAGGQLVGAGAQRVADPIQRVMFAAAVAELFLLDPAAGLFHRLESEPDHVKGVQYGGGVFEFVADRVASSRGTDPASPCLTPAVNLAPRLDNQSA